MFSICFAADCVCCAWMSRLLSSVLSLLLSDPAPPASHCAGAGAVCHLPLIFCHAPPLLPPTPRPPLSGSSTAEGLITVSVCSNRHSCLLNIILSPVCCPVCCSLLTVNICQLCDCERGGRCPRYNCADTQNTGRLSTAWQTVTMYVLFTIFIHFIYNCVSMSNKIEDCLCSNYLNWQHKRSIQKWNKQIPKIIVSISSDKW